MIRDTVRMVVLWMLGWAYWLLRERRQYEAAIAELRAERDEARAKAAEHWETAERLRADAAVTVREPAAAEPLVGMVEVGTALRVESEHGPLAAMYSPTGLITLVAADRQIGELVELVRWALERVRAGKGGCP